MADDCLHYKAIILILPLLWTDVSSQFPGFSFTAPRDVVVQTGLCVHIPCTFKRPTIYNNIQPRDIKGIWFRGNFLEMKPVAFRSSSEPLNKKERFFLTGDVSQGDCSLMINDAGPQDDDYYTFRVENNVNQGHTFNDFRTLVRVLELLETPVISPVGRITAGQVVTLSCASPGRCSGKPPLISWE
ncbi:myeloid cell surface antigen CD33-like [Hyla sarda]|uniref:myeloid cell surface antigen CD33-like n=1 Tax=Hyla sarda TaxID=327740 RepID=UPI0024C3DD75|nr:myeloid cell surface antigen CD33-like [Hyla sarda]XP_056398692.1 myeloid cell surface antigen CD33-like [Hyla sarda]XP_056398693.1 myeloid cell surface antigen CD33-like [Hyla sarda]